MVRQGDFEIQLVEAVTKAPFKEFYHDGKVYVEVEPGQEYFIAVKKVANEIHQNTVVLHPYVDGQHLNYYTPFHPQVINDAFAFKGKMSYNDGISTNLSLKFVIPKFQPEHVLSMDAATNGLGKVAVKIRKAVKPRKSVRLPYKSPAINEKSSAVGSQKSKPIRSIAGKHEEKVSASEKITLYDSGPVLDTVTLYYCATPGLIQVGVLPSPPSFSDFKKSEDSEKKRAAGPKVKTEDRNGRGIDAAAEIASDDDDDIETIKPEPNMSEIVDLTMMDDSSDEEEASKPPATKSS